MEINIMGKKKICSVCGTENSGDFQFCIHCGARLPLDEAAINPVEAPLTPPPSTPMSQPVTPQPFYAPAAAAGGMSEFDEMVAFIGPNGFEYANKMQNMKLRFKKASWNWPVFLFGFFLNIPFVWFYYRKMYKQATIILLATLAFLLGIFGCSVKVITPFFDALSQAYVTAVDDEGTMVAIQDKYNVAEDNDTDFQFDDSDMEEFGSVIAAALPQMTGGLIGMCVLSIGYLVFIILLSVYANNMYARHCEKKIQLLKSTGRSDVIFLRAAGGTSTLPAVLSGILFFIGINIVSSVLLSSTLSSFILQMVAMP